MRKLICDADFRLGQNGLDDFKFHPWLAGIDWDNLRNSVAPCVPEVSSPTDTSNFDVDDNDIRVSGAVPPSTNAIFTALPLPFAGFTFTQFSKIYGEQVIGSKRWGANDGEQVMGSNLPTTDSPTYENRIHALESENQELIRKLTEFSRFPELLPNLNSNSNSNSDKTELRRLQDEINVWTKRNGELEMIIGRKEMIVSKDLVDSNSKGNGAHDSVDSNKLGELEKNCKQVRLEKEEIQKIPNVLVITLLSSLHLATCEVSPPTSGLHGAPCSTNSYCGSSLSLTCTGGDSTCASPRPKTTPKYELVWNAEVGSCLAQLGTPCVGTKESPVDCVPGAECGDVEGQTPGVGMCQVLFAKIFQPGLLKNCKFNWR